MKKTYRIALCLFVLLPVVFSVGWGSGTAQLPDPPIPQTDVMRSRTTTILSSSVNPSKCGQAVTFTATVTSAGPTATGEVKFWNATTALGTATLLDGVAKLTKSTLGYGFHWITAQYLGDSASAKSRSPVVIQVVRPLIKSLSPASATAGSSSLTLAITGLCFPKGNSFVPGTQAFWVANGIATQLATTFVNRSMLTAVIPDSLLNTAVTAHIYVQYLDPLEGNGPKSNLVRFNVTD